MKDKVCREEAILLGNFDVPFYFLNVLLNYAPPSITLEDWVAEEDSVSGPSELLRR